MREITKRRPAGGLCALTVLLALAACETGAEPKTDTADAAVSTDVAQGDLGGTDAGGDNGGTDTSQPVSTLVINEVGAKGVASAQNPTGADWLELYNGGAASVDLEGYRVGDKIEDFEGAGALPPGTKIEAGGFLVVYFNKDNNCGAPCVLKGLKSDEEAGLYDPKGQLLDAVDWDEGDSPEGGSYGRTPDGGLAFKTFATPTPGAANK